MSCVIRPAHSGDVRATAEIVHQFQEETAWMPKLYSLEEVVGFCRAMIDRGWVIVAQSQGRVVGFLARDQEEVCSLYLLSNERGNGFGRALLASAKASSPRLLLRTFVANEAAQRFYHRQGFIEIGRGDGSTNEEELPDIYLQWGDDPQGDQA
ncbi:GNAT family N-acetyltransferase [Sedimentitalea sp. CY04]|uniref:GNAT family N-acetyltransferase n=1 Tax=Parasedimentitalea denitrificans TaxID=2211118 RepID=A0ABX0WA78_9RHOB|nr:GNAT family N-acetyltransferase [Sedimentitalea sp. CY04]NIZ61798.1 GNAT family N-acetyltransferase [Sedimentitalea sp. CY04]